MHARLDAELAASVYIALQRCGSVLRRRRGDAVSMRLIDVRINSMLPALLSLLVDRSYNAITCHWTFGCFIPEISRLKSGPIQCHLEHVLRHCGLPDQICADVWGIEYNN